QQDDALRGDGQRVEDLQGQLGVLDRRDAQGGDHHHAVGVVEHLEVDLAEVGAAVDDDVVEHLAQLAEDAPDVVDGDQVGELRADRWEQNLDPEGAVHHDLANEVGIHVVDVLDQIGDPLRVIQVEEHTNVAELQVEVDQRDLALGLVRHRHGEVGAY